MKKTTIFCNTHTTSIVILREKKNLNKPQDQGNQNATLIDLKMYLNQRENL